MTKDDETKMLKCKERVKSWEQFSLKPQTEEDIRNRILNFGIDSVCISYICKFSKLSEEFIDELAVLSTGYLQYNLAPIEYYKENYIELEKALALRASTESKYNERVSLKRFGTVKLKTYDEDSTNIIDKYVPVANIRDRLDWVYLSQYQVLSEPFIENHKNEVEWEYIFKSQNISDKFKSKYNDRVSSLYATNIV